MSADFFVYGDKETDYLKKKDKKLGAAIDRIGKIEREITPDLFEALIDSVIGQQISSKAAKTVFLRLSACCEITPENICGLSVEQIQTCGTSFRKAEYIKSVSEAALHGNLDLSKFAGMKDSEIITVLSSIKGIGQWTAEMMLIFSLQRPNVLSYGDLAIRRGMMNLYGHKEITKEIFEKYRKRYTPYASVASLYLWALS